jgi:hypothetical protein
MHYKRYMSSNTNGSHNNTNMNRHLRSTTTSSTSAMCNSTISIQMKWLICIIVIVSCFISFVILLHLNSIGMISNYNYSVNSNSNDRTVQQQQQFNEYDLAKQAQNLIIVAGHSVTLSDGHLYDANHDESDWYMLEYQKHHGLPEAIIGHIRTGIESTALDSKSLLIFSGGQTRAMIGPKSEGSSYYHVADAMNLWSTPIATSSRNQYIRTGGGSSHNNNKDTDQFDPTRTVRARTITEEYATDSFQNLLFSICRFYEITGNYPNMITMISYTFKQRRFETLHLPALHWPNHKFHYIGYDPSTKSGFDLVEATMGEIESAAKPFEHDPYGCYSKKLQNKRQERNPFIRTPPYDITCPDMVNIFHYCGQSVIDESKVPW